MTALTHKCIQTIKMQSPNESLEQAKKTETDLESFLDSDFYYTKTYLYRYESKIYDCCSLIQQIN